MITVEGTNINFLSQEQYSNIENPSIEELWAVENPEYANADLSNVPASKGILVESYRNGYSWFRVYSDGFCQQGGQGTYSDNSRISFMKTFSGIPVVNLTNSNGSNNAFSAGVDSNSSFVVRTFTSACYISWIASGWVN